MTYVTCAGNRHRPRKDREQCRWLALIYRNSYSVAVRAKSLRVCLVAAAEYDWHPRLRRHAEALAARGDSVTAVVLRAGDRPPCEVVDGVRVVRLPVRKYRGELILARKGLARQDVPLSFAAADLMLFTSRQGFDGSPSVVKEACAMGLPVVSDVGDVAEILCGVEPSAVVAFPPPGGDSRYEMVNMLTDQVMRVVATGGRSNGRDRVAHLSCAHVAGRLLEVYREIAH